MNEPLIIIQARTGSSRLPQKMTLPFYNGRCVLEILLERIKKTFEDSTKSIVVATTTKDTDNSIVEICRQLSIQYFRGSEDDVLNRFIQCAKKNNARKIIRICADNVFLSMKDLKHLYNCFKHYAGNDYISFKKADDTPSIKTHYGFWAEAVTLEALERVNDITDEQVYHEHVTNYVYQNPNLFKCQFFPISSEIEKHSNLRLTLDTYSDFDIQQKIYRELIDNSIELTPENIITYLDSHPDLYDTMQESIKQNSK